MSNTTATAIDTRSDAERQAVAQLDTMAEMMAAVDVDYDRLEELREERRTLAEAATEAEEELEEAKAEEASEDELSTRAEALEDARADLAAWDDDNAEELHQLDDDAGDCTNEDDARERIEQDPLSVEFRSAWQVYGEDLEPAEFRIVLCTGGPHVEIVGDLDEHGEPERPRVIYKDWGEGGELFSFDHAMVTRYCQLIIPS